MSVSNILLAFDSFKGSLSSLAVADCVRNALLELDERRNVQSCVLSDGGEGLLASMLEILPLKTIEVSVVDPLFNPLRAMYGWDETQQLAIIESAQANGLPLVSDTEHNPTKTTAYGVGELIVDALDRGAKTIMLGLGGSATNECGLSILEALGFRFYDDQREFITHITGEQLSRIRAIDDSSIHPRLANTRFVCACDVNNPLTGPQGATMIYGPQKGGTPEILDQLERDMKHIESLIRQKTGIDLSGVEGAGAAGGIAGGLYALLNAELKPGIEVVLQAQAFEEKLKVADLVITGEGKSDAQTLMGKVPMGVLNQANKHNVPAMLLSGIVDNPQELLAAGFDSVIAIKPDHQSVEEAMKASVAKSNLQEAIRKHFA